MCSTKFGFTYTVSELLKIRKFSPKKWNLLLIIEKVDSIQIGHNAIARQNEACRIPQYIPLLWILFEIDISKHYNAFENEHSSSQILNLYIWIHMQLWNVFDYSFKEFHSLRIFRSRRETRKIWFFYFIRVVFSGAM